MNRRIFTTWLAASGLTTSFAMSRPARDRALAHTVTPVPLFNGGTCNLELDFADFTAQLEIPEEIGWEQYDLIVS
ncbi:MAG: hypothetical protein M3Y37_07265, partial [Chloroflexota bacterium]|nr:hypothetical protein [Chloroflexota bacterium]